MSTMGSRSHYPDNSEDQLVPNRYTNEASTTTLTTATTTTTTTTTTITDEKNSSIIKEDNHYRETPTQGGARGPHSHATKSTVGIDRMNVHQSDDDFTISTTSASKQDTTMNNVTISENTTAAAYKYTAQSAMMRSIKVPRNILFENVESSQNQVAGHDGFYRCKTTKHILKPIAVSDIRSRREIYFYRMLNELSLGTNKVEDCDDKSVPIISNRKTVSSQSSNFISRCDRDSIISNRDAEDQKQSHHLECYNYYRNIEVFISRSMQDTQCSCQLDRQALLILAKYVPQYYGICRLIYRGDEEINNMINELYIEDISRNKQADENRASLFLSLEDLTAHCRTPCVVDVKIGTVTYDPNATKEKIYEESQKYSKLFEFGFRILGMKVTANDGRVILSRNKQFGRTLLTGGQISSALDSFFQAVESYETKCKTIQQVIKNLDDIELWFSKYNTGQLQFISSSILIVYDSSAKNVEKSVRVALIDFAHVFHLHPVANGPPKDENYLFGLRKLIGFLKSQAGFTESSQSQELK